MAENEGVVRHVREENPAEDERALRDITAKLENLKAEGVPSFQEVLKKEKFQVSEHKKLEMEGKLQEEPMTVENPGRFVIFPIKHDDVS